MRRQIDFLGQGHRALFQGTFKVHILDLLTEIGSLFDQRDEAVFHDELDGSPIFHPIVQEAASINSKSLTTITRQSVSIPVFGSSKARQDARLAHTVEEGLAINRRI